MLILEIQLDKPVLIQHSITKEQIGRILLTRWEAAKPNRVRIGFDFPQLYKIIRADLLVDTEVNDANTKRS